MVHSMPYLPHVQSRMYANLFTLSLVMHRLMNTLPLPQYLGFHYVTSHLAGHSSSIHGRRSLMRHCAMQGSWCQAAPCIGLHDVPTCMRVQVDANKTHQASREYNATLNEYLYGKICYSATPPPGTVGAEESNPGLPSVSEPGGCMPCISATAMPCCIRGEALK